MLKSIVLLVCLCALVILSGCGAMDAYRAVAADRSAQAADDVFETAMWAMCNGASIGAVRREYSKPDDLAAFVAWCNKAVPAPDPEPGSPVPVPPAEAPRGADP